MTDRKSDCWRIVRILHGNSSITCLFPCLTLAMPFYGKWSFSFHPTGDLLITWNNTFDTWPMTSFFERTYLDTGPCGLQRVDPVVRWLSTPHVHVHVDRWNSSSTVALLPTACARKKKPKKTNTSTFFLTTACRDSDDDNTWLINWV